MATRPSFIVSPADVPETAHSYPESPEVLGPSRAVGAAAGLKNTGLHLQRLAPGQRSTWPHAESHEEEFVLVLEGEVDAWIDGELYPVKAGDLVAFPAGTGICHAFLNNSDREVRLLVGGDANRDDNKIFYPLNPEVKARRAKDWWNDIPLRPQGPHDGKPSRRG